MLFVVAIDDREKALDTIDLIRKHFPHLEILARSVRQPRADPTGVEVVERRLSWLSCGDGGGH